MTLWLKIFGWFSSVSILSRAQRKWSQKLIEWTFYHFKNWSIRLVSTILATESLQLKRYC